MDEDYFSLVHGGPLYRFRKAVGLIPGEGLGIARRVAFIVALTWLPTVIGAVAGGRGLEGQGTDPLLRHYGVHARLLISIPLLIITEGIMEKVFPGIIRHFHMSGLISEDQLPAFRVELRRAEKLRDSPWGTVLLVGAFVAILCLSALAPESVGDEIQWAVLPGSTKPGIILAGYWFLFVARPVFTVFLILWAWRSIVAWNLLRRIAHLPMQLVPSHPDRAGGLGFVETISIANAPIVFAISVVLAGRWGHEVLYHSVHVNTIQPLAIGFGVLVLIIFLSPLLMLSKPLRVLKRKSLFDYGTLVGSQGRLVHRKWILGERSIEDPVLTAEELGPVADVNTMYEAVEKMKFAPIGRRAIAPLLVAAVVPLLPVFAIEVPIKDILLNLAKALV